MQPSRREPRRARSRLLGGFEGGFGQKGHAALAFPQVSEAGTAQHPRKTAQKSRTHGKIGAHFLQNRSEVAGCGHGQSRSSHRRGCTNVNRGRRCVQAHGQTRKAQVLPRTHLRPLFTFGAERGGAGPRPAPPSLQARPHLALFALLLRSHPFAEVLEGQRQHRGVAEARDGHDERFEQIGEERILAVDAANAPDNAAVFPTRPA